MKILNPFKRLTEKYDENQRKSAIAYINERIQIREYEGKLYICYDNNPLIEQSELKEDLCVALDKIRKNVLKYNKLV